MKYYIQITAAAILIIMGFNMSAQNAFSHLEHEELGKVKWYRAYDEAINASKKEEKSILILFQEVPGCATCRNYGHHVLTHPLMVEAIENLFIPLTIFNNKGGKDKKILNQFNEPTWNNPVVRFINSEGENLTKRIAGDYSAIALCNNMISVLQNNNQQIPEYLKLLSLELANTSPYQVSEEYFQMYCFWTGEKQLGKIDGVLETESGFMNHHEVVKIKYDPSLVSANDLEKFASQNNMKLVEKKGKYKVATSDVHYYLKKSKYRFIPLTELQKTKINSALGSNSSPEKYLSPRQAKWVKEITSKSKDLSETKFAEAWYQKGAENY